MNPSVDLKILKTWVVLMALFVLSLSLYLNTISNDFVLDDTSYIRDNHLLKDPANLLSFFNVPQDAVVEDLSPGFLRGRNVRWVTYAFDFAVGEGAPWVFHLSNIFWHFLAGSALYLLLKKWTSNAFVSFGAALFFLAHPVQTAAVAYISGRKDVLATLFMLLSLLWLQHFRESVRWRWLSLAGCSFFLALYSKEVAVVMIAILLWGDYCLADEKNFLRVISGRLKDSWREYLFVFVLTGAFLLRQYGWKFLSHAGPQGGGFSTIERGLSANLSFANLNLFYLDKAIRPINLIADYRGAFDFSLYRPQMGWWLSPLFAVLLVFFLLWLRKKNALAALGLGWFFIALLPVSHLVSFHYPAAEHYMYLPIAGFALALAALLANLYRRVGRPVLWVGLLLLCLYGGLTVQRNQAWQNMESITLDILSKAPRHPKALSTLVHIYSESGRSEQALEHALEISKMLPGSSMNQYNLGVLYEDLGETSLAMAHYQYAIGLNKRLWNAYLNLGNLLLLSGKTSEGFEVLNRLISLYGYQPLAFWLMGNDKARHSDWPSAYGYYKKALRIDKGSAAGHLGLAGYYSYLGDKEEMERQLSIALKGGLDIEWAAQQEPWTSFLATEEVRSVVGQLKK